MYSCLQTQAQRYLCVKTTRAAQKYVFNLLVCKSQQTFSMFLRVAWVNFIMCATMLFLCTTVGCLLYAKYSQCDPLQAKLISKPDQVRM